MLTVVGVKGTPSFPLLLNRSLLITVGLEGVVFKYRLIKCSSLVLLIF